MGAKRKKANSWWSRNWNAVVAAIVTAFVTYLVSDLTNFRSYNRELIAQEQSNVPQTTKEVSALLQKFSAKAVGVGDASKDDVARLNALLSELLDEATALNQRVPSAEPAYKNFTDAMIALRDSAEKLTGAADGKDFVRAVAEFYQYQLAFNKAVVDAQQNYTLPFIWHGATVKTASPSA
jgi:hypothetical protein